MKVEFKPDEFNLMLKTLEGAELTAEENLAARDLAQKLRDQKRAFAASMLENLQKADAKAAEQALKEPPK